MEQDVMVRGFECVRADERVIHESITSDQMARLGWSPCKVVEVRWRWQAKRLKLANHFGMQAIVLPGRRGLAVLWNHDASGNATTLYLVDGDTQRLSKIPDQIAINGQLDDGSYYWLGCSPHDSSNVFTCMYSRKYDHAIFRVDVDAESGSILTVQSSR